jgi:hypothetical protein
MRGETYAEITVTDAAGKTQKLFPAQGVIPGAPVADCDRGASVLYFNNSTNTMGLFICSLQATAGAPSSKLIKLDVLTSAPQPGSTGKALNRRVEVKLSK